MGRSGLKLKLTPVLALFESLTWVLVVVEVADEDDAEAAAAVVPVFCLFGHPSQLQLHVPLEAAVADETVALGFFCFRGRSDWK